MTDAPERIWVWPDYNDHFNPVKQDWTHGFWDSTEDSLGTEYVRADHIESQAAEIERLVKERDAAVHLARMRKAFIEEARDERDAFEAKLAKAVEAGKTMDDGCDCERCSKARATLAELTGKKP